LKEVIKKSLSLARGKKILIVEDNRVDRLILKSMLKQYFDVIVEAKDGQDGIQKYKKERFDIVLTDIMMPNMNGIELIKKIKKFDRCQHIAVISSANDSDKLIELIDLGINTFILKPLDKDIILTKIANLLESIYYKREMDKLAYKEYLFKSLNKSMDDDKIEEIKSRKSIDTIRVQNSIIDSIEKEELHNDFEITEEEQSEIAFLSSSLEDCINHLIFDGVSPNLLHHIADLIRKIGNILTNVEHFRDTSLVFLELGKVIEDKLHIEDTKPFELLELMWSDIEEFLFGVFINRDIDKIDYFTNSLQANIEILKAKLYNEEINDDTEITLF
jgi:CheY-like chemotaxis protein